MLESDAKEMLCPLKMAAGGGKCDGAACMGWQVWHERATHPKREDGTTDYTKRIPGPPMSPAQGHCGMVPPELECNAR